jgi:small subunit ribosomal protein S4e
LHRLDKEEAKYKLCKITKVYMSQNKVPVAVTHDGRSLRYPDPDLKVNDSVKVDIATGKASDIIKFDLGAMVMITKGHNCGRVGTLMHIEKHDGSFSIITVKDSKGNTFATRLTNVFVIGSGQQPQISLPKGRGIKKTILQERQEAEEAGRL